MAVLRRHVAAYPDWDRFVDGKPHRLRRKRHFDASVEEVTELAKVEAETRGIAVQITKDKMTPDSAVWIQFARAALAPDEPCPCGGFVLLRRHPRWAECAECGSLLILEQPKRRPPRRLALAASDDDREAQEAAPQVAGAPRPPKQKPPPAEDALGRPQKPRLDGYDVARVALYEEDETGAHHAGVARDPDGREVFFVIYEPRPAGRPIPDETSPTGFRHILRVSVPLEIYSDLTTAAGTDDLRARASAALQTGLSVVRDESA